MKTSTELLREYLANISNPAAAAALFAEDGVLELPWVGARVTGPEGVESLVKPILGHMPGFSFKNIHMWIETPERTFGEYEVETENVTTGKIYQQTYAGLLIAENGKIKLLREALDTVKAAEAFGD